MADSAFWRDLANQFRALPLECKMLRADRYPVDDITDELSHWQLSGTPTAMALVDALARHAGSEIQDPPSSDLLAGWLEALIKRGGVEFHSQTISTGNNPDGAARPKRTIGSLYQLPEHSANFCKMLESTSLQAEFQKKQQNDPRNWSQFRQQFEAFESIKKLHNSPAKTIPEEFVRNAIARIRGIKPEEVTPEQINFEVAGLLPTYPNIKLVHTVPHQESPVAETKHEYVGIEPTREQAKPEPVKPSAASDTIPAQLQRLREECRWTAESLAEKAGLDLRTVTRHLSGSTTPHLRNISAYERVFSKQLKRQVVINKMP